jgi:hypothetical protein
LVVDLTSLFETNGYLEFCRTRRKLFSCQQILGSLDVSGSSGQEHPYYILDFLTSKELAIKEFDFRHKRSQNSEFTSLRARNDFCFKNRLKLLNYELFNDFLMEHDSYVKEPTKNVPTSNVISYLKENKLTSLIYTYPVEKGVFRNLDIRLRVYLYDLKDKQMSTKLKTLEFYETFDKMGFASACTSKGEEVSSKLDSLTERMRQEIAKFEKCFVLCLYDQSFKMQWSKEAESSEVLRKVVYSETNLLLDELLTCREDKYVNYSPLSSMMLTNRKINYKQCIKNSIVQNNKLLNLLKTQTKDEGQLSKNGSNHLIQTILKLDSNTRGILLNRYRLIEAKWEDQFAASPAACLDSLHWTIKGFGLIRVLQQSSPQPGYKVDRRSVVIKPKECARLIIDLREQTNHDRPVDQNMNFTGKQWS